MDTNTAWNYLRNGEEGDFLINDNGYCVEVVDMCGGRYMMTHGVTGEPMRLTDSVYEAVDFLINTDKE